MKAILLFLDLGIHQILIGAIALLATFGFYVLIFLILRKPILWYTKANTIIENQEKQIELLAKLLQERGSDEHPRR